MKKQLLIITLFLLLSVFLLTLTACGEKGGTLASLQNEYGVTVEGGSFEKGSVLVSNAISTESEEAAKVLAAIADLDYDKEGKIHIFDLYVAKDGAKVQPSGKVKVSLPFESAEINEYVVFHIKADNSVETLTPTVADGIISFETDSFSYFVIADKPSVVVHIHAYEWIEGKEATCKEEGIMAHYRCVHCGEIFDENYGELASVTLPKADHTYGILQREIPADIWSDGSIAHYQCEVCEHYFDEEQNKVDSIVIPKHSTNLSICVSGTPYALELIGDRENYKAWQTAISVTKGDVITLCQTNDPAMTYSYFADGNVSKDGIILTTAENVRVSLEATPNGMMLFIDGFKYEGVVVEINGIQYPMHYVSYDSEKQSGYVYGYVNFAEQDKFVIIDNVNGITYDFDDLSSDSAFNTWDYHRGENGEVVIDFAARYGIEFDMDGDKQIYLSKIFAPYDGEEFQIVFEDPTAAPLPLQGMNMSEDPSTYEEFMFMLQHETTMNTSDILAHVNEKGLWLYTAMVQLTAGAKLQIKDVTANAMISADHLVGTFGADNSIAKSGEYVEILESKQYMIIYIPAMNSFVVESFGEASDSIYMFFNGETLAITPENGMVIFENLPLNKGDYFTFLDANQNFLPVILDADMDASLVDLIIEEGAYAVFIEAAGTYELYYDVATGTLYLATVGGGEDIDTPAFEDYYHFLSVIDYTNGNQTLSMTRNPENGDEVCVRVETVAANSFMAVGEMVMYGDYTTTNYGTLVDTDASIATTMTTSTGDLILLNVAGPIDVYFNWQTKTVRIVVPSAE